MSDRICDTCGNEFPAPAGICPFCHSVQSGGARTETKPRRVRTLNIKEDLPTSEQALRQFDADLDLALAAGVRLLRVIHGYGSSGQGGVIRADLRRRLGTLLRTGRIRGFVPGEEYPALTDTARALGRRHPELAAQLRTDRSNPGITFVEL